MDDPRHIYLTLDDIYHFTGKIIPVKKEQILEVVIYK